MKRSVFFYVCFLLIGHGVMAQANKALEREQKRTIETFFEGMSKHDTTLIKTVLHPEAHFSTVLHPKNKATKFKVEAVADFMKQVANKNDTLVLEERLLGFKHFQGDALATVWTPYKFYINQKLSHSGHNNFTMVYLEGKWLITAIIDTRKRP
jgi:hypothetical protein